MKRRVTGILLYIGVAMAALAMMTGCTGEGKAGKTAKAFLQAYHTDLDFAAAKTYATPESASLIDERRDMTALNPYAKSETPAIVFKTLQISQDKTTAEATYTLNRSERTLYLQKIDGKWKVDLQKEASLRNENMQQLSTSKEGGFASAASGPIVYKKRKNRKTE